MAAGVANFLVEQGATFTRTLRVSDDGAVYDMAGFSLRGQMRQAVESETVLATFVFSEIAPSDSSFTMKIPASVTEQLPPGTAYYDVEMVRNSDGVVMRLLQGRVEIDSGVTR